MKPSDNVLISVEELQLHRLALSRTYSPGDVDYRGSAFRQVAALQVNAVAELTGSEIRVRGTLTTKVEADCDRCLKPFQIPVDRSFDLFYRPLESIAREEEVEIPPGELDVAFYSGGGIQLADLVAEQVNLAVPMKLVCRPDCRGLCAVCGADRNVQGCDGHEGVGSFPFSALLD